MADLIAYQDGNWTGATTWKGVATSTGATQATISSSTNTTTSYVYSAAFTVTNAVVIEGVLVHCKRNNTTGTVSVALSDDNGTTATREVTVNASDLPSEAAWVFFKFGSTLTGDGGTDYKVGIKGSSASNATFYRNATAGNWARYLRTNTTATVAATDVTFICDELTGAGTKNDITVTMDSTSNATTYGVLNIGQGGVLSYGTTAATNYRLKLGGNLNIWGGGTFNMGTSGTPMPRDSTAWLEFASASAAQYGIEVNAGGTLNAYGQSRTSGKNVPWCLLNTDEAVNSTSLGVDRDTGWLDNDEIVLAPTNTSGVPTEYERGALNGNAGASTLTVDGFAGVGGGIQYAHSGTAPMQGEVINLTRNVKIFGASAANSTYINTGTTSVTIAMEWVHLQWLGSTTVNKRGLNYNGSSASSCILRYCSMDTWSNTNASILFGNGITTFTFEYNVAYFFNGPFISNGSSTAITSCTVDNSVFIRTSSSGIVLTNINNLSITNSRIALYGSTGSQYGVSFGQTLGALPTFTNNVIHHCYSSGVDLSASTGGTLTDCTFWRCHISNTGGGGGARIDGSQQLNLITFNNCAFLNNVQGQVYIGSAIDVVFNDCRFANLTGGDANPYGLSIWRAFSVTLNDCIFGGTSPYGNHSIADILINNTGAATIKANNTLFNATTDVTGQTTAQESFVFSSQRHDQTNNNHRAWRKYGLNTIDTTIFKTASPSERIAPNNASSKTPSGSKRFAVATGTTATVKVWVRESVVGDGTDYNGNRARLIVKRNDAAGITADTVLATATVSSEGAWEELSGTTATVIDNTVLEVYVDCDGTTGWINVDDWSVT